MGLEYANDIACIKSAIYCCFQTAQKIFAAVNYRDKKPALQTTYVTYRFTLPGQAFEKWNHTKSVASTGGIKLDDLLRPVLSLSICRERCVYFLCLLDTSVHDMWLTYDTCILQRWKILTFWWSVKRMVIESHSPGNIPTGFIHSLFPLSFVHIFILDHPRIQKHYWKRVAFAIHFRILCGACSTCGWRAKLFQVQGNCSRLR